MIHLHFALHQRYINEDINSPRSRILHVHYTNRPGPCMTEHRKKKKKNVGILSLSYSQERDRGTEGTGERL